MKFKNLVPKKISKFKVYASTKTTYPFCINGLHNDVYVIV